MLFDLLYRMGRRLALLFPLKISYAGARILADLHYFLYVRERRAIMENLKIIFNRPSGDNDKELKKIARDVFRNFAKYLVDFLRFSEIDMDYVKRSVAIEGMSNLEEALKHGKGVIILSAHIGNWELGGYTLGKLGYSINAVVLTHQNKKVNDFFINQRGMGNFKSIEIGASLRGCYKALNNNELLALLGDRNFSNTGLMTEFFGRPVLMPIGPAALSVRIGAVIVPTYIVRNDDDTFKMVFEEPIYPEAGNDKDAAVKNLVKRYIPFLERAIREYAGQWYVFKKFWESADEKSKHPDTIV